jgi:hypothetical protein
MSSFDWESFLKRWSQEILESLGSDRNNLPPEVIESGWLGYPGATDKQIAQAEARLGTQLPPSYRAFLKVTNGWRQTTPFINKLWSTAEIEWFSVRNQSWLNVLLARSEQANAELPNSSSPHPSIPDEEYLVYGRDQDCSKIRAEYLQTALEISQRGEAAIYLLNPQIVTETGDWEAWFLGDWLPGADRYRSFQEMMQAEYENFLELRDTPPQAIAPTPHLHRSKTLFDSNSEFAQSASAAATEIDSSLTGELAPMDNLEQTEELEQTENYYSGTSLNDWRTSASFMIEIQSHQGAAQSDQPSHQRTLVRHMETGTSVTFPNLDAAIFQQWIPEQIKTAGDLATQASLKLEIMQLRVIRSPQFATAMVADSDYPLFGEAIETSEPFTLEVLMRVIGANLTEQEDRQLIYRTQCFAHHLPTQSDTCIGDITIHTPVQATSVYVALFPEIRLQQPGIYRLKVWVTLQNAAATPGYFKVPLLQVV